MLSQRPAVRCERRVCSGCRPSLAQAELTLTTIKQPLVLTESSSRPRLASTQHLGAPTRVWMAFAHAR